MEITSITDLQPKMRLRGTVKETHMYGAVVDIGLERDGVIHISQLSPTQVNRVTDVVQPGDSVTVWVTKVDPARGQIGLTMIEPPKLDWHQLAEGQVHTGTVTRLESYGAFVDIGAERPGLLHVREMSVSYVRHPSELMRIGEEIEVRILKVDRRKRRIDLTMLGLGDTLPEDEPEEEPAKTTMEIALQRAQTQQPQQQEERRHKRQSPDLSEREGILTRTLAQHSQH
ncbi:MAG: S1 RNA-binding domain-containing protein [Anaerolineae bacterium]